MKEGMILKSKKRRIVLLPTLLLVIVTSILTFTACEGEDDYARITDVEYKAVVLDEPDEGGKILITERLTFDIHAASKYNLFWELWRDLPETYIDGLKVDYKVHSVKQILEDGTEIIYDESDKLYWDDYDYVSENPYYGPGKWFHSEGPYDEDLAQYECVLFYVDGLYREQVVFEIEYEMRNAAFKYNDCSELYIGLYSGESIEHLNSYKAEILFPLKDRPLKGNYEAYAYGTNANSFTVKESATKNLGYHTFYFELDESQLQFKPYNQFLEFDLVSYGDGKHIFTDYAPDNYYTDDDVLDELRASQEEFISAPERYAVTKKIVLAISAVISVLIVIYSVRKVSKTKKKYTFYEPEIPYEYFREIPSDLDPNFAASLVFCKDKKTADEGAVYSALLLSLARKDYIRLMERSGGKVLIYIKNTVNPKEPLTPCEKYYYNLVVRHAKGDHIHMDELQQRVSSDYNNTQTFAKEMKDSIATIGVNEGYFQKTKYKQPQDSLKNTGIFLIILGCMVACFANLISFETRLELAHGAFFLFGAACVLSAIYLIIKSKGLILLTQKGEDEYAKWRGLYKFLDSDTLMNERTVVELPLWEQYLVYATAFGISEKVIAAIKIRCPEVTDSESIVHNTYCRSGRIRTTGRSFSNSVHTGSSMSSSGGSYSSHGGGGRGGGGGGGGH